jgi:hypothetical protein
MLLDSLIHASLHTKLPQFPEVPLAELSNFILYFLFLYCFQLLRRPMDLRRGQILQCIGEESTSRSDLRIDDVVKTFASFGRASGVRKGAHPGRAKMAPGAHFMRRLLSLLVSFTSFLAGGWGIASFTIARSFSASETKSLALNEVRCHSEGIAGRNNRGGFIGRL